jgi:hypothetical protein
MSGKSSYCKTCGFQRGEGCQCSSSEFNGNKKIVFTGIIESLQQRNHTCQMGWPVIQHILTGQSSFTVLMNEEEREKMIIPEDLFKAACSLPKVRVTVEIL